MSTDMPPLPDGRRFVRQDLRLPLQLAFCGCVLDAQGWDASQVSQRMAAARAELERRYPVAEGAVTAEQQARQDALNERTLLMVTQERSRRQFLTQ
jgi:hypothetical protein